MALIVFRLSFIIIILYIQERDPFLGWFEIQQFVKHLSFIFQLYTEKVEKQKNSNVSSNTATTNLNYLILLIK